MEDTEKEPLKSSSSQNLAGDASAANIEATNPDNETASLIPREKPVRASSDESSVSITEKFEHVKTVETVDLWHSVRR